MLCEAHGLRLKSVFILFVGKLMDLPKGGLGIGLEEGEQMSSWNFGNFFFLYRI